MITIKADKDGQVWIHFDAGGGRKAMVNLNNIVKEMQPVGITKCICLDAINKALEKQDG